MEIVVDNRIYSIIMDVDDNRCIDNDTNNMSILCKHNGKEKSSCLPISGGCQLSRVLRKKGHRQMAVVKLPQKKRRVV